MASVRCTTSPAAGRSTSYADAVEQQRRGRLVLALDRQAGAVAMIYGVS